MINKEVIYMYYYDESTAREVLIELADRLAQLD
jgi:hypothetical protein